MTTPFNLRKYLAQSTKNSGVPLKVQNPEVLGQVRQRLKLTK